MNIVTHNLLAMNTQRQLGINTQNKAKSTEKLSSGYKINRAADDAAGLSISEKMRRQIRGLSQGIDNTQEGVSLCQVADGALAEVNDMLHRVTELSVKAANGTNTESDRQAIQEEINQIMKEIDRISDTTTFNEQKIFDATGTIGGGSIVGGGTITTIVKNPNMMTEAQALQELRNANFSIGQNGIVVEGGRITSDSMEIILTEMSTNALWLDFRAIQSDLSKKDEVNKIFNQIYDNLCITSEYEGCVVDKPPFTSEQVKKSLEIACTFLDEAMNETDTTKLADLTDRFRDELMSKAGIWNGNPTTNISALIKAAERYYQGLGGVDQFAPGSTTTYLYLANAVGCFSQLSEDDLLVNDLGTDIYDKITESNIIGNSAEQMITRKYIAYANVQDGYDANGEKEVTTTVPGKPVDTNSLKIWIQSGAEAGHGMFLEIDRMNTDILGIGDLDVSTVDGANHALDAVKGALQKVSANRSKIGAQQNRLEHTIANEENVVENTTAAESAIRDTDMAKEMVQFSKDNILEQVGQAMLTQSNQSNQGVLKLLQ